MCGSGWENGVGTNTFRLQTDCRSFDPQVLWSFSHWRCVKGNKLWPSKTVPSWLRWRFIPRCCMPVECSCSCVMESSFWPSCAGHGVQDGPILVTDLFPGVFPTPMECSCSIPTFQKKSTRHYVHERFQKFPIFEPTEVLSTKPGETCGGEKGKIFLSFFIGKRTWAYFRFKEKFLNQKA